MLILIKSRLSDYDLTNLNNQCVGSFFTNTTLLGKGTLKIVNYGDG